MWGWWYVVFIITFCKYLYYLCMSIIYIYHPPSLPPIFYIILSFL
eukprot:UN09707